VRAVLRVVFSGSAPIEAPNVCRGPASYLEMAANCMFGIDLLSALCFSVAALGQTTASLGPVPGELIDVYGHKLHIHCVGPDDARPIVILEAGGGGFSKDWSAVETLLASDIRTCAYDRAGLGWSEPGPAPRTLKQEVFELHTLLKLAKLLPPFIMVGQSIGALDVRLYTKQYPNDVAGIALIDPTDESSTLYSLTAKRWIKLRELARGRAVPPVRTSGPASTGYNPEDDYLGDEAQLLYFDRLKNPRPLDDRPLLVLAAGKRPPPPGITEESYKDIRRANDEYRREQAHFSTNSRFIVDANSGHNIQTEDPKAVADVIRDVVKAVQQHARLAK